MRLLNTTKFKLEEFEGNNIPLYAILSHTWGENEITFQDFRGSDIEKEGEYKKIRNTCSIAADHGFHYVWIDTCCIDKTSSAELSEAINSMYRWYQESGVCYAYLADVPSNAIDHQTRAISPEFSKSSPSQLCRITSASEVGHAAFLALPHPEHQDALWPAGLVSEAASYLWSRLRHSP